MKKIQPDIPPPNGYSELTKGFLFNVYSMEVQPACSSSIHHSYGRDDKTTTQGTRSLYSTRKLALQALRQEMEFEFNKKVQKIDKLIKAEK